MCLSDDHILPIKRKEVRFNVHLRKILSVKQKMIKKKTLYGQFLNTELMFGAYRNL